MLISLLLLTIAIIILFILVTDPCTPHPCDANANCTKVGVSGDFTCSCIFPYSGNGTICTGKEYIHWSTQ
jgi:hypothetical protein